jgi:hypothetical protein
MMIAEGTAAQVSGTFVSWLDHPAIAYRTRPTTDPVARLEQKLQTGQATIAFEAHTGYLRSVLAALSVPIESQIAVFVKDSVQAVRITHENPRAIFFNDSVAVGWVPGGFIELASQDPEQGTILYTLEQRQGQAPQFTRRTDCLTCHHSYATVGVPGMLVRSVGQFEVDHRLPLEQRWGGWYVTGASGALHHRGNIDVDRLFESPAPVTEGLNWSTLEGRFDTAAYLTPSSDIAALMVFDHQMHAINLITRLGWEARVAHAVASDPGYHNRMTEAATELVDYLLFVDEAPIAQKMQGSTKFAAAFSADGTRDAVGRSLHQLDLERRLSRYPCSYIIDTPQFDALPDDAKKLVYERLWQVLSGRDKDPKYAHLSAADRSAVLGILRDTKKEARAYFQ